MNLNKHGISFIYPKNLRDISNDLLMENGRLKLLSYKEYDNFSFDELRYFCHVHARYGLPTIELIDFLKEFINGRSAIEIGSGHGDLGYYLGIPMTDSKQQRDIPRIVEQYKLKGQPVIDYPEVVEKLEGLEAINKYKPQVVIGSWLTTYADKEMNYPSSPYGFKEPEILSVCESFVIIGNIISHGQKPICDIDHKVICEPWIKTRASTPDKNCIYIWNNIRQ